MKTILSLVLASMLMSIPLQASETEAVKDTASEAVEKTTEAVQDAGRAVADTTKKVTNTIVETVAPDPDAKKVEVTVSGSGIDMPKTVSPGKTAFVVKNNGKARQNFEVEGAGIDRGFLFALEPEQSKVLQATLKSGKYKAYSKADNGKEKRMEASFNVR